MPRKPRELVDGGIYHVFNRGNDRMSLFQDEQDFKVFLKYLFLVKQELASEVYHYCIMTNHFHILLKVQKGEDLPKLMHRLQLSYARYFKRKYDFEGHVFQERFRSPRILEESYYLQCGRYIERNPVKAGLTQDPSTYAYSSAAFYAHGKQDVLVTPNLYYQEMAETDIKRESRYREFLLIDEPYGHLLEGALFRS